MTSTARTAHRSPQFPSHLIELLRKEVPSLRDEMIAEIRRVFPGYNQPMDGPYGEALRAGVGQALDSFLDRAADPAASLAERDQVFRWLGTLEAAEGRTVDDLLAASVVGARVAWQRVLTVGARTGTPPEVIGQLADSIFGYIRELAALAGDGHRQASAQSGETRRQRKELLRMILETPPVSRTTIADLADDVGWVIPEQVTAVAVRACSAGGGDQSGPSACRQLLYHSDVLGDLSCRHPHLLLPGPLTADLKTMITAAGAEGRAAAGPAVPLESAADSLRWARQALALAESGIIAGGPVVPCEQHMTTLLLLSDVALARQITQQQRAVLDFLAKHTQEGFGDAIEMHLHGFPATEIAARMDLHQQTIRNWIRPFDEEFRDQLTDPQSRFQLLLALRLSHLLRDSQQQLDAGVRPRSRGGRRGRAG